MPQSGIARPFGNPGLPVAGAHGLLFTGAERFPSHRSTALHEGPLPGLQFLRVRPCQHLLFLFSYHSPPAPCEVYDSPFEGMGSDGEGGKAGRRNPDPRAGAFMLLRRPFRPAEGLRSRRGWVAGRDAPCGHHKLPSPKPDLPQVI